MRCPPLRQATSPPGGFTGSSLVGADLPPQHDESPQRVDRRLSSARPHCPLRRPAAVCHLSPSSPLRHRQNPSKCSKCGQQMQPRREPSESRKPPPDQRNQHRQPSKCGNADEMTHRHRHRQQVCLNVIDTGSRTTSTNNRHRTLNGGTRERGTTHSNRPPGAAGIDPAPLGSGADHPVHDFLGLGAVGECRRSPGPLAGPDRGQPVLQQQDRWANERVRELRQPGYQSLRNRKLAKSRITPPCAEQVSIALHDQDPLRPGNRDFLAGVDRRRRTEVDRTDRAIGKPEQHREIVVGIDR